VTPAPEVTVNFMASFAPAVMLQKENPAPMGVLDAGLSSMRLLEGKRTDHKFALTVWEGQQDINVEVNRTRPCIRGASNVKGSNADRPARNPPRGGERARAPAGQKAHEHWIRMAP
jgi:hypothetical protein